MKSVLLLPVALLLNAALSADERIPGPVPHCNCMGLQCECCGGFNYRRENQNVCIRTVYDRSALMLTADLLMNGYMLSTRTLGPGSIPFCVPAPPLRVCLNARTIQLQPNDTKVCGGLNVRLGPRSIYRSTLPCLVMDGGQFHITRD